MAGAVVVGYLSGMPQAMSTSHVASDSLEQGIEAAKDHYRLNFANGVEPQFRVYQDGTGYALVEVSDGGGEMRLCGLYKVIAGKYQFVNDPKA